MYRHLSLLGADVAIVDWSDKFYKRTPTRGHQIAVPVVGFGHWLLFATRGKTYRELVGAPKDLDSTDWIIDEFDHNFNALAVASLHYHLDFSECDNESRREKYEDLIARLGEPGPEMCDSPAEEAVLFPSGRDIAEWVNQPKTPQQRALLDRYRQRTVDHRDRIQQARHDFVDIMPELWS